MKRVELDSRSETKQDVSGTFSTDMQPCDDSSATSPHSVIGSKFSYYLPIAHFFDLPSSQLLLLFDLDLLFQLYLCS